MNSQEIRQKYLDFFKSKDHRIIPSAPLVPANDPTVLFTTAGMHPLVPFLMGEPHPQGTRLANFQKCLRTDDIDEVGDETHNTFFEMLGNWSLGDYWKKESISWSYEFLTDSNWLGIDKSRLAVTVFEGDANAPRDEESAEIWKSLGMPENRIAYLGKKDNWWGPPGTSGPCGPDTEIFYWIGQEPAPENYNPQDKKWVEIWNNVFMQYEKTVEGKFISLKQQNVDTGMGLERITTALMGVTNVYETDLFQPIMQKVSELAPKLDISSRRIISDHIRASVFMIADGVVPSNKDRGYILRRLIRRSITHIKKSGVDSSVTKSIAQVVVEKYNSNYPELNNPVIFQEFEKEEEKFKSTLNNGLKLIEGKISVTGKDAFDLFQSYGFPFELTRELVKVENEKEFHDELAKHQELSRTSSAGQFKGGLASHSGKIVKLHTATHLLNAALRKVLGPEVWQKGSNITEERTRFDFTHNAKMTDEQKQEVEKLVNEWVSRDLQVKRETLKQDEARKLGAIGVFGEKYADEVSVYTVVDPQTNEVVSREFCGGPHVEHTGVIGPIKIQKEEAVSAGVRRIKATING
jgi:alanyl-tRNA synthetase